MGKRIGIYVVFALLVIPLWLHAITVNKLPFEMTFDNAKHRAAWTYLNTNNSGTNSWVTGSQPEYAYVGNYMLYMSKDGGATRSYTPPTSGNMRCFASCAIESLPAGTYTLDFHYRGPKANGSRLKVRVSTKTPTNAYAWGPEGTEEELTPSMWWEDYKYTFTADGSSTYYILFFFEQADTSGKTYVGWAVDDIQIYPAVSSLSCTHVPENLTHQHVGNSYVFNWAGNASEYQVQYYWSDTARNVSYTVGGITSTTYTIQGSSVPEGTYNFRVRSICGLDTSAWEAIDYQLIYDVSRRCVDYIDIDASSVQPEYGTYSCPNCSKGKVNYGFESSSSRHTIHHYPHDYDERTNNKLRTFPRGLPAAVRLGNWETGGQAEDIVYTMKVTPDLGVLQLQYALVMQLPDHTGTNQPRFTVEFLDSVGEVIDPHCGVYDITATTEWKAEDGWHRETPTDGSGDIIWKEWSKAGLNMHDYVGRTVKIRITTKDCDEGTHFGYGYFALSCSPGILEGTHCDVEPDSLYVDDGFYYRWYHEDDKTNVLDSTRVFHVQYPRDTATVMCVDMINKIDTTCYFTLKASTLAYMTRPDWTYEYTITDCKNLLKFFNHSTTDGVYTDYRVDPHTMVIKERKDTVLDFYWDLGQYGRSNEWEPNIEVSKAGGTIHVTLHTFLDDCEHVQEVDIKTIAIGERRTVFEHYFCKGDTFPFRDSTYTKEGTYITDSLTAWTGCDSLIVLNLHQFRTDTLRSNQILCQKDSFLDWHGQRLTETGFYTDTVRSKRSCGCDSIIYFLDLFVQPILRVTVDYEPQSFCNGYGEVEVPFVITSGNTTTYDLLFSEESKKLGFKDQLAVPINEADHKVVLTINEDVWAGHYEATLVFHNRHCDTLRFPIPFTVYYDPDVLITQRWNDFLSIRKTAYDYYGGFYDYQWYQDGLPMAGKTSSQLYLPQDKLQMNSYYWAELTRTKDGVRMRTCDFYPTLGPDSVTLIITISPTFLPAHQHMPVRICSSEEGRAEAYAQSGERVGQWTIKEDDNQIYLPSEKGLYLLRVTTNSGQVETRKIIVE